MKIEEAIDLLDNLLGMIEDNHGNDYDEALHMAISALKKQVPKKIRPASKASPCACPMCGFVGFYNYCGKCGQAIDWTEAADDVWSEN